jgi:hypothetical protein
MIEDENFSLEVLAVKENEDGSATLTVEMGPSAAQYFIELGILTALTKTLADLEKPETG